MVAPWIIQMIPTIAALIGQQTDSGGTKKVEASKEQKDAIAEMMKMSGEDGYGGSLGNYDMSGLEKTGTSRISQMLGGQLPEMFRLGSDEIKKLLTTDKFDPYAKGGVYSGMKRNILREQDEQQDILSREGAKSGRLSSKSINQERGLLGERTSGQLSDVLASLYQRFSDQKLSGATTAAQMGGQEESMQMGRTDSAFKYGGLPRMLETAKAAAGYEEWKRARGEKLNILSKVAKEGATSAPVYQQNPWSNALNTAISQYTGYLAETYG